MAVLNPENHDDREDTRRILKRSCVSAAKELIRTDVVHAREPCIAMQGSIAPCTSAKRRLRRQRSCCVREHQNSLLVESMCQALAVLTATDDAGTDNDAMIAELAKAFKWRLLWLWLLRSESVRVWR